MLVGLFDPVQGHTHIHSHAWHKLCIYVVKLKFGARAFVSFSMLLVKMWRNFIDIKFYFKKVPGKVEIISEQLSYVYSAPTAFEQ